MRKISNMRLRDLYGVLKDKASISKAVLLSKPKTSSLHLALLRATTHEPTTPPEEKHITTLLSFGHSSRNTASTCIEAIMDRLGNTHNSFVAFKCLLTVHYIIKKGSFILQDQLSVYPSLGGRNYLNLSNFRDISTPESWNLSYWVRWYARVLESILHTSRNLGFFISSRSLQNSDDSMVSSFLNKDLFRELDVLVNLIEELCKAPELLNVKANKLVTEAMCFLEEDKCSAEKSISIRVNEFIERVSTLSFADSVELVCVLKRLENCKEKILSLFMNKTGTVGERLWGLVEDLKEKIGEEKKFIEEGRGLMKIKKRFGVSESARFDERVLRLNDSVRFGSCRLDLVSTSVITEF